MSNEECKHQKVFADISYPTNPPQTPWVCKLCGTKGIHIPTQVEMTYEQIIEKFKPKPE